jgi:hypothetical protein
MIAPSMALVLMAFAIVSPTTLATRVNKSCAVQAIATCMALVLQVYAVATVALLEMTARNVCSIYVAVESVSE